MKNITFTIAVLVLLAASSDASAQYFQNFSSEPTQRFNIGFTAWDRPNDSDQTPVAINANNGRAILTNEDIGELGGGTGPDISYIFGTEYNCQYEIRGLFAQWNTLNNRAGTNITSPLIPGAQFTTFNTDYDSTFFSLELNQRNDLHEYFTSIIGIRYTHLEEQLDFIGTGILPPPNPAFPLTVTNRTEVKNPMIGLQIGGESRLLLLRGVHLDLTGKGGVYSNNATQSNRSFTNFTGGAGQNGSNNDATVIGEFAARLHYDLIEDRASVFVGYNGIYLHGVAVAARNVAQQTGIDDQENIGFNGLTLGLSLKR